MSAIAGVFHLDGEFLDPELAPRMLASLKHRTPDASHVWNGQGVGLAHGMLWTTPESLHEIQPVHTEDGALVLVSDARIDNRDELIAALSLPDGKSGPPPDSELILAAYRMWGEHCLDRLLGDFAFAIWDKAQRRLFCARDPAGVRSFYYCHRDNLFAFASEIKALFEVPNIPRRLNEDRIADHLILDFDNQESTFFCEIYRLLPGCHMHVSARGRRIRRYWSLDPNRELNLKSDREYEDAFRELFADSVRCSLRSAFPIGSTLSGGLDSSSIACTARECLKAGSGTQLHTFSAIFPSLSGADLARIDERRYVQAALAGGHMTAHEVHADLLNPLGDLVDVLWHQDDPLVPFNLYVHLGIYACAREHGVRILLDGTDGDTTISHGFERLPELAKSFRWGTLLAEARAVSRESPGRSVSTRQVLTHHALAPLVPAGIRNQWNAMRGHRALAPGCESVIAPDFASRLGLRAKIRQRERASNVSFKSARTSHLSNFESPLLPYLLELADKSSAAYSVEARYPFFDRRLMEFCLALPADQKLRAGWGRSILRRGMQGVLPPEIQWRKTKADLSPNFHRSILGLGRESMERLVEVLNHSMVEQFIDIAAVTRIYDRYRKQPSNPDAMTLFLALTFSTWLARVGK